MTIESKGHGPPYTFIRVERFYMPLGDLAQALPGLIQINLDPPSSGPEYELVFGTGLGAVRPVEEDFIKSEVERVTQRPVLAIRRAAE